MQAQSLNREDPPGGGDGHPPVLLPGEPHGQRSLAGYSPWGRKRAGHDLAAKGRKSLVAS